MLKALGTVNTMLAEFQASRNLDLFSASSGNLAVHVTAQRYLDSGGVLRSFVPFLDATLTISSTKRPALLVVEAIVRLVSRQSQIKVELGIVPTNLLATHLGSMYADSATARDILEEIARQLGAPISWQLFCDPGNEGCALNMHMVQ
jgi:hypothetical protein